MSVGPTGVPSSIAGSPLAQTRGTDVDRVQQETANQAREVQGNKRAELAAGIGQTEEDQEASDRDADGRRPWERAGASGEGTGQDSDSERGESDSARGRDATGQTGNYLDLSG